VAEAPRDPWWSGGQQAHPWAAPLGLAIVAALAAVDIRWGQQRVIIASVVMAPFVTALLGSLRQTAAVALVALAVCAASGAWNDNLGTGDWVARLFIVGAAGAFALTGARARVHLALDRRRFRLLNAVAGIAEGASTVDETVQRLSDLMVPTLADVCVIDVQRDEKLERLAVTAAGPRARDIRAGLERRAAAAGHSREHAAAAMASGKPQLVQHATDDIVRAAAIDEADLRFLRTLGGRSTLVVPLRARGQSIGSMALIVTDISRRKYDADDLAFATLLGGRVALALDNAGLFSELESLEAQQSAALDTLAEAVTVQDPAGGLVYANEAAARSFGFPSAEALLGAGVAQLSEQWDAWLEDGSPLDPDALPARRVLRGEPAGPLLLRAVHRTTGEERWRLIKASAVLDRTGHPRLAVNVIEDVTEAKRAESAQRFLAEAGALLASSLDYEETLAQVARLAVPELADWCGVTLPDDRGLLRSVAVAHVDPDKVAFAREYNARYPESMQSESGSAQVIRNGRSQLYNEIPDELLEQSVPDPEQLAALRMLGMRAVMIVPMPTARGVIGTISFVSAESHRTFTPNELRLAEELGRRAGTAVENARLYTERSWIARTLQAGLLPDALPELPGFGIASLYRPAGEENVVGGDFYDAFDTPAGWMIVMGDVTGRGAQAAALTAQARHTLRSVGRLLGEPRRAVEELNASLIERAELSICTVAVVLLAPTGWGATATILCAGHPSPLRIRTGEVEPVGRPGPVVGAWDDAGWETETVDLLAGDILLLHTDGVTDAVGAGGRFGDARLAGAVAGATSAQDAVVRVRTAVEAFERGPQADDTALLAVHCTPVAGRTRAARRPLQSERWTAPAVPASVGLLRGAMTTFATDAGVEGEALADLRLAVSEALTNAVVHGYPDGAEGELGLHALVRPGRIEVTVEDDGIGLRPRSDSPGMGLGMPMIAALALESSVRRGASGGTVVRMAFPLVADRPALTGPRHEGGTGGAPR
jgi:PAS domain S-box-containing protein